MLSTQIFLLNKIKEKLVKKKLSSEKFGKKYVDMKTCWGLLILGFSPP